MGTDEVCFVAKATSRFDRTKLRDLIVELWTGRGATLASEKWSKSGFGYAIGPTMKKGWIAVVDSGSDLAIDRELLQQVAKATNTWMLWNCDHSAMYGQKRITKSAAGKNDPVDLAGCDYESTRGEPGWEFLSFRGVKLEKFERFGPEENTKSDPLPKDAIEELEHEFTRVVLRLDVERALAIVKELGGAMSDECLSVVFSERYPIEYKETSQGVSAIGQAIADVRELGAEEWIRLLEVAAVRNDAALGKRAAVELVKVKAKAFAEARARFAERNNAAATKRFEVWLKTENRGR